MNALNGHLSIMSAQTVDVTNQIYIGNLDYRARQDDVVPLLEKFGKVTQLRIICAKYRGKTISLGFGYATFETKEAHDAILAATEPIKCLRQTLKIQQAKAPVPKKRETIHISGIPEGTTVEMIQAIYPKAKTVRIVKADTADRRGYAFVKFETEEEQKAAVEKAEIDLNGKKSTVSTARIRPRIPYGRIRRYGRRGPRRAPRKAE